MPLTNSRKRTRAEIAGWAERIAGGERMNDIAKEVGLKGWKA